MYFFPLAELREMRKKGLLSAETLVRAYELYGEEMINLHLGQGLDIWWHGNKGKPNEKTYLQMCAEHLPAEEGDFVLSQIHVC